MKRRLLIGVMCCRSRCDSYTAFVLFRGTHYFRKQNRNTSPKILFGFYQDPRISQNISIPPRQVVPPLNGQNVGYKSEDTAPRHQVVTGAVTKEPRLLSPALLPTPSHPEAY